jgi:hypothetical protein
MANQKISELTTATSPSVNDVLPIVNGGSTKKITASSLMSDTLSASTMALSGVVVRKSMELFNPRLPADANNNCRNELNVFLHAANIQIAIGDSQTGQTFRDSSLGFNSQYGNIFIGVKAGKGVARGANNGTPNQNIAIGTKAGYSLGGDDDLSCSYRARANQHNTLIGHFAGRGLCADTDYVSSKNVAVGSCALAAAGSIVTGSVAIGFASAMYMCKSRHNTFIGYRSAGDSFASTNYPKFNVAVGACAGRGLRCSSSNNVMIGYNATVNGFNQQNTVNSAVAVGNNAYVFRSSSVAIGAGAFAYNCGDVVLGTGTRSSTTGNNTIVIGRNNSFNTNVSGSIVLGSCNCNISTHFVLGSPVFPLSARPDTTLTGQISSLFVTINGVNRRIPILS